jgi:NTP pyrophosphatase (non-canonical NTP hydrolase)
MEKLLEIFNLAKEEIQKRIELNDSIYKKSEVFLEALESEIQETKNELKESNSIYLEDEISDILWSCICLMQNLEIEGKISVISVISKCLKKFTQRSILNRKV